MNNVREKMYENLHALCIYYDEDFDDIYEAKLDPVEYWCGHHDVATRKQLLVEMEEFLKEVEVGTKNAADLSKMGMQYNQSIGGSWDWFRDAMEYLKKKIAEG